MPKLHIQELSFTYPKADRPIFSALDLAVEEGEFLAVLGPSGCGKSTLLHILAGLDRPQGGRLLLDGAPISAPGADRGIVFQDYSLFPWMTAARNVAFCASQADRSLTPGGARALAMEYLSLVGLKGREDSYPGALSGGMRQRVAIAKTLAMGSPVMLFDEPFGALDPSTRIKLQGLLEQVWQQQSPRRTVVFVTHDIDEAMLLADRVVYLDKGAVRADFSIPFPRPRSRETLLSPEACALRKRCLKLFQESEAENDA